MNSAVVSRYAMVLGDVVSQGGVPRALLVGNVGVAFLLPPLLLRPSER